MTYTIRCPRCDKKYSLKEKPTGIKAKCSCGCIFRIGNARSSLEDKNTNSKSDTSDTYLENESGRKSISESKDSGLVKHPKQIIHERSMATEILIRLGYGCPGLIIMSVYIYYKSGLNTALFVTAFGTIAFCIVMYKGISVHRERAAERDMTYEQYTREWGGHKAKSVKLKFNKLVLGLSFILLMIFFIPNEWTSKVRTYLAFGEHWKTALLILVLNFPLLLFVATLQMGNWRKFLKTSGRLFLWHRLPFHYLFKGYWRTITEMSKEELFGWAATHMLYIWVCFLEYLVIKAIFFS